ncbi:hypothetical protein KCP73_19200 [Salmonella enterica subsp. enterica]|nr:hypothetical protein KCP73_19200 [Salmonella enterica subsp. enterica]
MPPVFCSTVYQRIGRNSSPPPPLAFVRLLAGWLSVLSRVCWGRKRRWFFSRAVSSAKLASRGFISNAILRSEGAGHHVALTVVTASCIIQAHARRGLFTAENGFHLVGGLLSTITGDLPNSSSRPTWRLSISGLA